MTNVLESDEGSARGDQPAGTRAVQPRHLIVTVYGMRGREVGGWFSVATLVRLLADLGVDEPAVRSSVSRLKRRGVLTSARHDGAAGYALSPEAGRMLDEGDRRIFSPADTKVADGWLLATFSVPEAERDKRHTLRTSLSRLGFGTVAPGVWIAPAHLREEAIDQVAVLGLDSYVEFFLADHLPGGRPDELAHKVRRWWDLDRLQELYSEFLVRNEPVWDRWERRRSVDEREAFVDYVPILTAWRRLPYLDPGLPSEVLPPDWNGTRAAELFGALRDRLERAADAYVDGIVGPT